MTQKQEIIGSYRRFGRDGVVYQVISAADQNDTKIKIRVLETGEETLYSFEDAINDPIEH